MRWMVLRALYPKHIHEYYSRVCYTIPHLRHIYCRIECLRDEFRALCVEYDIDAFVSPVDACPATPLDASVVSLSL